MRRLSTIVLSFVFVLSSLDLGNAQPLNDSSAGDVTNPAAHELAAPDVVVDNNQQIAQARRQASLAGEPKWVTPTVIANSQRKPKSQRRDQAAASERRPVSGPTKKSKEPAPNSPKRKAAAVFAERKYLFRKRYWLLARRDLYITSGYRTPRQQALAMRANFRRYGIPYVVSTYGARPEVLEIARVYKLNRRSPRLVNAMTRVIADQVRRGVYISNHMRWRAMDVRSRGRRGARLSVLRQVAQSMGARVSFERSHFHVEL